MGAKFKKSLLGGLLLTLATFLVLTSLALADPIPPPQKTWDGPDGANWNIDANWDPDVVPVAGDDVLIDKKNANVLYLNSSNPKLNFLRLGLVPSETLIDPDSWRVTLTQEQDILTVKNTEIGSKGTADYIQFGGSHKILHDLTLGTAKDGEGNYSMIWGGIPIGRWT